MPAWRMLGRVRRKTDGAIEITGLGRTALVARAPPGIPFRWMVSVDGRSRPAVSVAAVLRQVRSAFDPAYARNRARIAQPMTIPDQAAD